MDIHFLHVRSPHEDALPLLMTHGWPGSVVEFRKVIGPLTDPARYGGDPADAFHVVCPSLPGYGFSGKPAGPAGASQRIADAWAELMAALATSATAAQGGDWGSTVTTALGHPHPEHLAGIHLNMLVARAGPGARCDDLTAAGAGRAGLARALRQEGLGLLQAAVDPAADARLRPGRFPRRAVRLDRGEVLVLDRQRRPPGDRAHARRAAGQRDAVLAARHRRVLGPAVLGELPQPRPGPVNVPVGCSIFPKEIFRSSRRWAEQRFTDLRYWNELDRGGHFAAFEQPGLFTGEVRAAFRPLRQD